MSNLKEPLRTRENRAGSILWLLILPLILVPTGGQTRAPAHHSGVSTQSARVVEGYGKLPLAFEANQGQTDAQVKFLSRGAGYSLFLTSNEAVLTLGNVSRTESGSRAAKSLPTKDQPMKQEKPSVLRMKLLGTNAKAEVTGQGKLPGKSNYFLGNDPKKWRTDVPQYAKVRYANIYPGVDLVYYGNQRELEYDFVVQPGSDPNVIRLGIDGVQNMRLDKGDLVLSSAAGDVHLRCPHVYQEADGARHSISGGYVLKSKNEAGFSISNYDPTRSLIIDPVLAYSSYLGGSNRDGSGGIAVDSAGSVYITGETDSTDFPTVNAIQPTMNQSGDAIVTKINADGTGVVYSTYLGGRYGADGWGIAVDGAGEAYVTGPTQSDDFPTLNAIQASYGGGASDAFVTKISASGSALVYSSYLGGSNSDGGYGIAVDSVGRTYVTGVTSSTDFPTRNAIRSTNDGHDKAFVTKINANGSLVYSTYLGGASDDLGLGIAADSAGNAYITGFTYSTDFPTANALQLTNGGYQDAFVTKINATGSALVYSTYLGGSSDDEGQGIVADTAGNAYVTGYTWSFNFPTSNALQSKNHGVADVFVTKINATGGAFIYSTYLGGSASDYGFRIGLDTSGNVYLTGSTLSTNFPRVNAIQSTYHGGLYHGDVFVTKINAAANALVYSTYLGGTGEDVGMGIAVDAAGTSYVSGRTYSANFPFTTLGLQHSLKGSSDAFVTKIASQTFVSVSPAKVGLGTLVIGKTSAPKQLTVINQGSGTLLMNNPFIGGANASDFAIQTNNCPPTLSAGGFCTVSITFTPSAKNKRQAALGISDSDPASPQAIPLSGIGTIVSLSPKSLAFGKVLVGNSSSPKAVILTNLGSTQLNFTGISITGTNATDFSQTNTCGTSIAAGANCTITVTFNPTAIGTRRAAVSIYDDGGGSPQKIALTGTGI